MEGLLKNMITYTKHHYYYFIADLTVAITGLLGSGKTSACNFFCNHQVEQRLTVSEQSSCLVTSIKGKSIKFIDTPGFCDSHLSVPEDFHELSHALMLSRSGVHAFVMVLDTTSRFSKANVTALQDFFDLGEVAPYTLVVFTKAKQLAPKESEQKTVILEMLNAANVPDSLSEFMLKIKHRFMLLESVNYMGEDYYATKSAELLQMLDAITTKTNGMFTCYLINHAKELYENEKQRNLDELSRHNAAVHHLLTNIQEAKQQRLQARITGKKLSNSQPSTNLRAISFCLAIAFLGATIGYTYMPSILGTVSGASLGGILGEFLHNYVERQKMKLPPRVRCIPFCFILGSVGTIVGSLRLSFEVGAFIGFGLGIGGKFIYEYTEKQPT